MKCFLLLAACVLAMAVDAQTPRRRALLIGIDDYSASAFAAENRGWPDLKGAVNDAGILREMLILVHGFRESDIVTLTNQQATRAAILQTIERHLVAPAAKGDVIFYYYAGHGSQVPNPHSDEPDRLDESIVPADSRAGARDIRDKELRPMFNRILDRGAHLTLLLDHCHSGSGFRGLPTGARPRGIRRAREVRDATDYGPRPEERGALVLASTQDLDAAWETRGDDGRMHGAFTWAFLRAMRDAADGEPVQETFLRAQARLRAETPYQAPVLLGPPPARLRPFLGTRLARQDGRTIVAVERVDPDGTVVLQGGWAHGLAVGTELAGAGRKSRIRITAMLGLGRSAARVEAGRVASGMLVEVTGWAAPPGRPLRVWAPRTGMDIEKTARRFRKASRARWLTDPFDAAMTHVLRPRGDGWELLARDGSATHLATEASAIEAVARLGAGRALFAQFPIAATIGTHPGITFVEDPRDADYILAGRSAATRIEYAWVRPLVRADELPASPLPQRTAWLTAPARLRESLIKLRRIHAWNLLPSPAATRAPYRLALVRNRTRELVRGSVTGNETYSVALRATQPPATAEVRYYYAFVIDSHGKSHLVFPASGSVENRFPIRDTAPPEIRLGSAGAFQVIPPYGVDTYFLLSTDEPLPNPSILAWDGVRMPPATRPLTALEELILTTTTGTRASRRLTTSRWSIERVPIESVPPRRR